MMIMQGLYATMSILHFSPNDPSAIFVSTIISQIYQQCAKNFFLGGGTFWPLNNNLLYKSDSGTRCFFGIYSNSRLGLS
jgi:hypothetical protein